MKKYIFFIFFLSFLFSQAQPLNKTVTDCNGTSKNIQAVLGTGKALVIAQKGVDCSICMISAPTVESFAAQNSTKVEVWGAMTWKYNPNTFSNPCNAINNWNNTHGWSNVFAFADMNREWLAGGTPRYYVYSPRDSSIVYAGSSLSQAQNRALAESIVGLTPNNRPEPILAYGFNQRIYIQNIPKNVNAIRILDLSGKIIAERKGIAKSNIQFNEMKNGIYFIQLEENNFYNSARKVIVY